MLKIIESESRVWTVIAEDGDIHIYNREDSGDWSELSLSDESEATETDKNVLLEALYMSESGGGESESGDDADEEDEADEEPELQSEDDSDEADDDDEDEAPRATRPRRSRARTGSRR